MLAIPGNALKECQLYDHSSTIMSKHHSAQAQAKCVRTAEARCQLKELLGGLKQEPELVCMVLGSGALCWTGVCKWLLTMLCDVRPPLDKMIRVKRGVTLTESTEGFSRLCKYFRITGICLNDLGLHPDEAKRLCEQIRACETLTGIRLDMHTFPRPIADIFIHGLRAHSLKRLTLCCDLTRKDLALLVGAWLGTLRELRELKFRIVPQQESRMPPLKEALRKIGACHNMEALTLSSMQIKDGDLEELLRAWKHMPLSGLNLADNCLSEKSIEDLLEKHRQFSQLNLSGNPLGPRCPQYLKPTFESLGFLSLKSTDIGAQGVSVLAQDAHRLPNLEHLDISDNGIDTEGGPAIVQLLTQCKALKHFDVSSNSLGSALNERMHSAIAALRNLCYIDLRNNGFSSEQVDAFYEVVFALDRVLAGEMEFWISV